MNVVLLQDSTRITDDMDSLEKEVLRLANGIGQPQNTANRLSDLWTWRDERRNTGAIVDWLLVYLLQKPSGVFDTKGEELQVFRQVQIAKGPDGLFLPPSLTWRAFCSTHLDVPHTQASNWKRNIEVYHDDFGFSWGEMLKAGEGKLNIARAYFAAHKGNVPQDVMTGLMGSPDTCPSCTREQVGATSHLCEKCQEPMNGGVQPLSYSAYETMIQERRAADGAPATSVGDWRFAFNVVEQGDITEVTWVFRNDATQVKYELPLLHIDRIEDNVVGVGCPESLWPTFMKALRRKFK